MEDPQIAGEAPAAAVKRKVADRPHALTVILMCLAVVGAFCASYLGATIAADRADERAREDFLSKLRYEANQAFLMGEEELWAVHKLFGSALHPSAGGSGCLCDQLEVTAANNTNAANGITLEIQQILDEGQARMDGLADELRNIDLIGSPEMASAANQLLIYHHQLSDSIRTYGDAFPADIEDYGQILNQVSPVLKAIDAQKQSAFAIAKSELPS